MTWTEDAADLLSTSLAYDNVCQAEHPRHTTALVEISLDGPTRVPDYPPFLERFRRSFDLVIYDWTCYVDTLGYCTGDDAVSQSIDINGLWEGFETLLAIDILSRAEDPFFIDLGCQIGWYTMLAGLAGAEVLAVDGDAENLLLMRSSAERNGFSERVTSSHAWLSSSSPVLQPGPPVSLLKADVEGAEIEVARICAPLFQARTIEYALMEITPAFSDQYPKMVGELMEFGYMASLIPDKGAPVVSFAADPLGETLKSSLTISEIAGFGSQQNILLTRLS